MSHTFAAARCPARPPRRRSPPRCSPPARSAPATASPSRRARPTPRTPWAVAFFRTLPAQIAQAALIDGCGPFALFFRVMAPMAKPGLISVAIFNLLGQWNQYLLAVVLISDHEDKFVLAHGLAALAVNEGYRGDYSRLFAGLTLAMLPVLVVYAVFPRQVQSDRPRDN